jgi:hypothetical protein
MNRPNAARRCHPRTDAASHSNAPQLLQCRMNCRCSLLSHSSRIARAPCYAADFVQKLPDFNFQISAAVLNTV